MMQVEVDEKDLFLLVTSDQRIRYVTVVVRARGRVMVVAAARGRVMVVAAGAARGRVMVIAAARGRVMIVAAARGRVNVVAAIRVLLTQQGLVASRRAEQQRGQQILWRQHDCTSPGRSRAPERRRRRDLRYISYVVTVVNW